MPNLHLHVHGADSTSKKVGDHSHSHPLAGNNCVDRQNQLARKQKSNQLADRNNSRFVGVREAKK